ncbi:MAG: alkaline phosphatase D family protein [Acidobacteriota bacterium]
MKPLDRRAFLRAAGALTLTPLSRTAHRLALHPVRGQAPAIVKAADALPIMPQGIAAGDVGGGRAVIWSRCDRAARLFVEYSTSDRFQDVRRVPGPAALESSDFTARVQLTDLPAGQRIFYRVLFQDLTDLRAWSRPETGSFRTPPPAGDTRDVKLAWSADTVGQGWGLNPEWGGLRMYETMQQAEPDMFVNVGDTIYADQPVQAEVMLDDGTIWRNIVTPAKSKAAETVADFRGAYQYNLLDAHMRRFNAEVPQITSWDDHEVHDNWYPTRNIDSEQKYTLKSMSLIAAHAKQAFFEYNPLPRSGDDPERVYRSVPYGAPLEVFPIDLRSYRSANNANRQAALGEDARLFGPSQLDWLKARLLASRATWKVIASDLPIGLVVPDGASAYEAFANGDDGPPLGRELEIADLLRFIRDRRIRNTVWITADVHYCAAHYYDPSHARFTEFEPFWEFVAGPLHAGTFGPNKLEGTFGPQLRFSGVPPGMKGNRPPSEGLQFYGTMTVSGRTRAMTVALHNLAGKTLYTVELPARS